MLLAGMSCKVFHRGARLESQNRRTWRPVDDVGRGEGANLFPHRHDQLLLQAVRVLDAVIQGAVRINALSQYACLSKGWCHNMVGTLYNIPCTRTVEAAFLQFDGG